MREGPLQALEFDRIVAIVAGLAVTPAGRERLAALRPSTGLAEVRTALRATSEGVALLADDGALPLRAPAELEPALAALGIEGRPLEALRLLALADFLESVARTRRAIVRRADACPHLAGIASTIASFEVEIGRTRRAIDAAGEVVDSASPALASIRERLRAQRQRLRATLDGYLRGRDTARYLQEPVITDRNGRYVLMVRTEHRDGIPGVVHGASASGASLFLEPIATVGINNDIVALEEAEAEEVRRILLALTDGFRARADDMDRTIEAATEVDAVQARARFSGMTGGVEPTLSLDGTLDLQGARHPLLMPAVRAREGSSQPAHSGGSGPVPVDIVLRPPTRVLIIGGPNTGGKTVAIKTAGLLTAMAQAGLHVPAERGSQLPIFRSLFADIGDEQSISANLSTFSAHVANVVSMDRELALPALVLLDEVGAGTDPSEGGALGIAVIDHFRRRGAHLIATTHYDTLKAYAAAAEGAEGAAFGFHPDTYAPTYRLHYGSPGRSLALEIAARYGMPPSVIAAARGNLSDQEQHLADQLARVEQDAERLREERLALGRDRARVAEAERTLQSREAAMKEREEALRRRTTARVDEQVRKARREIDAVIDDLKAKAAELSRDTGRRVSTGEAGAARVAARAALDAVTADAIAMAEPVGPPLVASGPTVPLAPGVKVAVGPLGLEGTLIALHGKDADIDVRGKRLRAPVSGLRVIGAASTSAPAVRVSVDLQPREATASELNVIGCTVDVALDRVERFIDEAMVTDHPELRIVHGHGTGQLRRAIQAHLAEHPLVAGFQAAPRGQGGDGATLVTLRD